MARADFLERVRQYSFLVTLIAAVYLGFAAATGRVLLLLDDYRGVYTSGWIGVMVALVTTTWVSLVGFYVVKGSVQRDRTTRVGQILAATPVSRPEYLFGKFVSNFAVLSAIVGILALAAMAMYFVAGEAGPFSPWGLVSPFVFLSLPMMALTASAAVVFEVIPGLRGGFGNVAWFFGWGMLLGLPDISHRLWLDPLGVFSVMNRMVPYARAAIPGYKNGMSLTIASGRQVKVAENLRVEALSWSTRDVLLRLLWVGVGLALVLLVSLIFDRFRVAPGAEVRKRFFAKRGVRAENGQADASTLGMSRDAKPAVLTPIAKQARARGSFLDLIAGEFRLALKGLRWWWYVVALGIVTGEFFAKPGSAGGLLLAVAWLWPVLIWSAMGNRERKFGVEQVVFSSAHVATRQLPACWLVGVAVSLLMAAGTITRLVMAGSWPALIGLLAGALFVPASALALGVWSGGSKFFEGLYTAIWYIGPFQQSRGIDFTGGANVAHPIFYASIYAGLGAACLVAAYAWRSRQVRNL